MSKMTLLNKRIVVTRAKDQSASLIAKLREDRALVLYLPLIDIVPSANGYCPERLTDYDWLVLTSVNAVRHFGACLNAAEKSYADLRQCRVAAIGEATARALRNTGVEVHVVPETHVSGPLIEALLNSEPRPEGKRVLLPQGNLSKSDIADALEAKGMSVTPVVCYETVLRQPEPLELQEFLDFAPDGITFFSPSAVHSFTRAGLPEKLAAKGNHPVYASIGSLTTRALQNGALSPFVEARQQSEEGIIDAMKTYFG